MAVPGRAEANEVKLKDLLKQIVEDPSNDELRLLYAASLESDPERTHLIRLQLQVAGLGLDSSERRPLAVQIRDLLSANKNRWMLQDFPEVGVEDVSYHRGFVEGVTMTPSALLNPNTRHDIFDGAPVAHLDIVGSDSGDRDFIKIIGAMTDVQAQRILSICIDGQGIGDRSVKRMVASLRALRWFSADNNKITAKGTELLCRATKEGVELAYVSLKGNPGDPSCFVGYDQGFAVHLRDSKIGRRLQGAYPTVEWLQTTIIDGVVTEPNRFELASPLASPLSATAHGD
jgi:uncharacterized protein (TIGR02996 family)